MCPYLFVYEREKKGAKEGGWKDIERNRKKEDVGEKQNISKRLLIFFKGRGITRSKDENKANDWF